MTSAQSLFAVAVLMGLHLSLREAGLLVGLFLVQFVFPETQTAITIVYIVLSVFFFIRNRAHVADALRGSRGGQRAAQAEADRPSRRRPPAPVGVRSTGRDIQRIKDRWMM